MGQHFQILHGEIPNFKAYAPRHARDAFFIQEVLRFRSVAGTMEQSFPNVLTSIDERTMSHIWLRSLIENYFKLLYIYDDPAKSQARFHAGVFQFRRRHLCTFDSDI